MIKSFLKDSVIYAVPQFLSRGLSLILVPLYTRVLSPADYGSLDLFTVFSSIVNLSIALEISQAIARFYTKEEDPKQKKIYASTALWFTIAAYSSFSIIFYLIAPYATEWVLGQKSLVTEFKIGMLTIWLGGIVYIVQNQFRWELKSLKFTILSISMTLVTAGVTVWLAYFLKWGLTGVFIGYVSGFLVGSMYGLYQLRTTFTFQFSISHLKEMLMFSLPLVPSSLAVFTSNYIDRIMINSYLDIQDVGLYGIGFRIASVITLLMAGFRGALTPLVYTKYKEEKTPENLAIIFRIFTAIALLIFASLTLFAKDILVIMTTPDFYRGEEVVIYLVPAILLAQIYIFAPGMYLKDKTKYILYINLFGACLNTILNWILIPYFGMIGAGLATLLGALIVFIIYVQLSQKFYYIPYDWSKIIPSIIIVVIVTSVSSSFEMKSNLEHWLKNVTSLLIIMSILIGIGLIKISELTNVKQVFK